ncbi:crossover junction endodeoxyribonuclease RuvC [Lewinellaceae bacterium SD302]|nr:crossover junction endodeoxyribonuclease RuvC [Lewinellaceae bacterium SD302]
MPKPLPSKSQDTAPYRILGIDPGTTALGFAIVEIHPRYQKMVEIGTLKLAKFKDHAKRLDTIYRRITQVINTHQPTIMAIEAPFFGKNPQSMLKLGRAQGVCMAAAMGLGCEVHEYAPRKIKQSIAGNGNASKEQVAAMLAQEFSLPTITKDILDATDALGAAMCHYYSNRNALGRGKSFKGWEGFLAANPNRLK